MWAARADAPDTAPGEAERLRADAAAARAEAARLAEQITDLEAADAARAAWFTHTAVTRDNAERARVELKARGVDPDHPGDQTTAAEWLAIHRAEQADHERHQPITEHDIAATDDRADNRSSGRPAGQPAHDEQHRQDERIDEPAPIDPDPIDVGPVETGVLDVRDVSTPDATETADPTERRRVPTIDETTQAVQRAQASLAEIAQRHAADTARAAADAAERDATEAARRVELARWSEPDTDSAADTAADTSSEDEPALER